MQDRMMKVLYPPLIEELNKLYMEASKEFMIVSPWIKHDVLKYIIRATPKIAIQLRVLTVGKLRDFARGSSDIESIEWLLTSKAEISLISNLHAKIYIADRKRAILTSANLTSSGLRKNIEVGILINDQEEIDILAETIDEWFKEGRHVDDQWLNTMRKDLALCKKTAEDLHELDYKLQVSDSKLHGPTIGFQASKANNTNGYPESGEVETTAPVHYKTIRIDDRFFPDKKGIERAEFIIEYLKRFGMDLKYDNQRFYKEPTKELVGIGTATKKGTGNLDTWFAGIRARDRNYIVVLMSGHIS
jgi:hypothetical protein